MNAAQGRSVSTARTTATQPPTTSRRATRSALAVLMGAGLVAASITACAPAQAETEAASATSTAKQAGNQLTGAGGAGGASAPASSGTHAGPAAASSAAPAAPTTPASPTASPKAPAPTAPAGGTASGTTAKTVTVSVPFAWANGQAVKATVVERAQGTTQATSRLKGYSATAPGQFGSADVLRDGRMVGMNAKGQLMVREKNGKTRAYNTGAGPVLDWYTVQGNTVVGLRSTHSSVTAYVFTGTDKPVSKATTFAARGGFSRVAYQGGKLYFDRQVGSESKPALELRSVALGSKTSKLVASNAGWPQVSSSGELLYLTTLKNRPQWVGEFSGVKSAKTGKTTLSFTGKTWLSTSVWDDATASLRVDGSTVAVDNAKGKGTLIMDTATRKAWFVKSPGGMYSDMPSVSGTRTQFSWINPYNPPYTGRKEFGVFDTKTGRLTVYTTTSGMQRGSINGSALGFTTQPRIGVYSSGSGLIG